MDRRALGRVALDGGSPVGLGPVVGRSYEIDALERALDEARSGRGGVVLLVGETGIGKTRLLAELSRRAAVAEALRPVLGDHTVLALHQEVGDPRAYRQHPLHVASDGAFSLVALVWLPGQSTPIHDHLARCVVGVHEGAEYETRYTTTAAGRLIESGSAVARVGEVAGLVPPGDIHHVEISATTWPSRCTCTALTSGRWPSALGAVMHGLR
jgi:predicted metal-dependent enzyme (double-stranded beta helix superfamily)